MLPASRVIQAEGKAKGLFHRLIGCGSQGCPWNGRRAKNVLPSEVGGGFWELPLLMGLSRFLG